MSAEPRFFASQAAFRAWLGKNHATATELLVGLHKTGAGKTTLTYKQALDEALCYGWIDGVRRSIDAETWSIRFSPRKPVSKWSKVNIKRMEELLAEGKVHDAGRKAYEARGKATRGYAYEEAPRELGPTEEKRFKANKKAWNFFIAQPPGFRRVACFWVMSAKKEETKAKRLAELIAHSAKGTRYGV